MDGITFVTKGVNYYESFVQKLNSTIVSLFIYSIIIISMNYAVVWYYVEKIIFILWSQYK